MSRPNIIYIVCDDLGYADLGCYGGREAAFGPVSPHIDRLAAGGMKFTQGYANSPVCSPTRFAIMTMRYQYRLRGAMEEPINSKSKGDPRLGLPPEIPTLPSLLREAGYHTGLVGQGHLKLQLRHAGVVRDAIWFGRRDPLPGTARLAYRVGLDAFNGQQRVQMLVEAAA